MSIGRTGESRAAAEGTDPHRWWGLVVIALAQLMVVLDATIVNIALPSAQRALHMSDGNRQWVITAYTLAFGGLLLLGGRIADLVGRKRTFVIGLAGFALASALGGAATGSGMLYGARALQGVFAAVLAPSALSLLTTMFTDPRERGKAFGVYSALAGSGSAIGLIVGGVLTEYLTWRWCLYVNVPIAALAVFGAFTLLHDRPGHRDVRLDVPGVLLGCGGLVAIVYGFGEAQPRGWSDPLVLALLAAGVLLLVAFVWWQARAPSPLLPLRILRSRDRAGCLLTMTFAVIGMFGLFLFMTYYLQVVLGYSPVRTGLAFLPMTAAIVAGSTQISARLLPHVPPRRLLVPGMLLATGGLLLLTRLTPHSSYAGEILPALLLLGLGLGLTFMPVFATATAGVAPRDAGVTSA
ncbi:MFS transporter, partial [Streptomyces murinus]